MKLYLKEDVYFEPLINHWYAWPYLIPPVTAARYVHKTHRRIMKSFVDNYQLHIMASQESAMTGGEFLNARADQVDDIKSLIKEIDNDRTDMLALSDAVKQMDDLCREHSSGESIEPLYHKVPELLRGYVEINMDMNHHVVWRLLEPLLYQSPHYDESLQKVSFGSLSEVEERPFCFSTPRLADEHHIKLDLSFNDPRLQQLLDSRTEGLDAAVVEQIFSTVPSAGGLDYQKLFSDQAPQNRFKPVEQGVRLRFFGHATFMVETADVCVLMDPVIATRGDSFKDEVLSFTDLPPKIDYVCITHNHQDHFNIEALLQLKSRIDTVVVPRNNGGTLPDPSMKLILQQLGFKVMEVADFDHIPVVGGKLTAIPFLGEHGDLNVLSKAVWFIELLGKKFFFGADATNYDPIMYQKIQQMTGDVDVLAIGMECVGAAYTWLYGALNSQVVRKNVRDSRRLNGSDSVQANNMIKTFSPKEVYLYAMGMEPWYKYFMGVDYGENSRQITESQATMDFCQQLEIPVERLCGKKEICIDE